MRIRFIICIILITSCKHHVTEEKTITLNWDSVSEKHEPTITSNQKYIWANIVINDNIFDSVYLYDFIEEPGEMESSKINEFILFNHRLGNSGYSNFLGLIDTKERKWIFKDICNKIETKCGILNPTFIGSTSDNKYFIVTEGDAGGGCEVNIYKYSGEKVFQESIIGIDVRWTKNDELIYWNETNVDTLPELTDSSWIQKFIWKNEKIIETNSFQKRPNGAE